MKINRFNDYSLMSSYGSQICVDFIKKKPNSLLSVATGNSTLGLYKEFKKYFISNTNFFSKIKVLKLDDWILNSDSENLGFCEKYIRFNILLPLGISMDRYISFNANTSNPEAECLRIYNEIRALGSIDICILGLGKNGHLGFIEPGAPFHIKPYVAKLSKESQNHEMVSKHNTKYISGFTLSINQILSSKKVIILVSGEGKQNAIKDLLSGEISTNCPASFLWLHNDVECLINENI